MSTLATLAASLSAGQWGTLATSNIVQCLGQGGGSSGIICEYASTMVWDSTLKRAHYLGADHYPGQNGALYRHVYYDDATNTWVNRAEPSWFVYNPPSGGNDVHGYNLTAISVANRYIYRVPFGGDLVRRWNIDTDTWDTLAAHGTPAGFPVDSLVFFPDRNSLLWSRTNTDQSEYSETSHAWLSNFGSTSTLSSTWQLASYNPIQKLCLFGSNTKALWKYTSAGVFTRLTDSPYDFYDSGTGDRLGLITVDPVNGTYLALTDSGSGARSFKNYNVVSDVWSSNSSSLPSHISADFTAIIACPCDTYGVTLFAWCNNSGNSAGVEVYKHADSGPGTDTRRFTMSA